MTKQLKQWQYLLQIVTVEKPGVYVQKQTVLHVL